MSEIFESSVTNLLFLLGFNCARPSSNEFYIQILLKYLWPNKFTLKLSGNNLPTDDAEDDSRKVLARSVGRTSAKDLSQVVLRDMTVGIIFRVECKTHTGSVRGVAPRTVPNLI